MAQRTEIVFTDDLDCSEAQGSVSFAFDGVQYEIDLSQKNADKLAKALEPYVEAGRRVRAASKPARRASSSGNGSGPKPSDVRAWAREQGIEVKDKGRVPGELIVRFQAAG
jgi:hypothetical protein